MWEYGDVRHEVLGFVKCGLRLGRRQEPDDTRMAGLVFLLRGVGDLYIPIRGVVELSENYMNLTLPLSCTASPSSFAVCSLSLGVLGGVRRCLWLMVRL